VPFLLVGWVILGCGLAGFRIFCGRFLFRCFPGSPQFLGIFFFFCRGQRGIGSQDGKGVRFDFRTNSGRKPLTASVSGGTFREGFRLRFRLKKQKKNLLVSVLVPRGQIRPPCEEKRVFGRRFFFF